MKGNAGINMYSFKATLFEVFEVLFGKPRKRGNIFGDKTKVSFGKKKNTIQIKEVKKPTDYLALNYLEIFLKCTVDCSTFT